MFSSGVIVLLAAALAQAAPHPKPIPVPQGVTALISPGPAPSGCAINYAGMFGIAAISATGVPKTVTRGVKLKRLAAPATGAPVTQISDAQPQAPTATLAPITQISDAQPQAPTSHMTHTAVSQIHDGQVQAYYSPITQISDAQPQAPVHTTAVPQAPTQPAVSQPTEGQPQAPKTTSATTAAVSQATTAAQPQAGTMTSSTGPAPSVSMVACLTNSTLELSLSNGRLTDGKGRIGYIASNFQFQFDEGVPQAGAIYTTGFSVCDNGTLALGGSAIWWQCLSGNFFNLYDRDWAAQCSPVYLRVLGLKQC